MMEGEVGAWLTAFISVVMIDIVLAGDNAVVVGAAASGLPLEQKRRVIFWGLAIAFGCRVVFAVVAVQLLAIIGLLLAGGILLLWVSWKMYRDLQGEEHQPGDVDLSGMTAGSGKTFRSALTQVAIADISMSLDNVLAVAGAARDHIWTLVFGLVALDRPDGRRCQLHRHLHGTAPLARLCRPRAGDLHRTQDDLGRRPRGDERHVAAAAVTWRRLPSASA